MENEINSEYWQEVMTSRCYLCGLSLGVHEDNCPNNEDNSDSNDNDSNDMS